MFLKSGISYRPTSKEALNLQEVLPAGNYTIAVDQMGNFYLNQVADFSIPTKLYGNTNRHTNRIIHTFLDRPAQTGVLLNGEKGSGKSLLAKNISHVLAKQGIPTIVINNEYTGDAFFQFLQNITQPCVILFDEFEKIYGREEQEQILTLLDGVFGGKKLYMFTVNDKWRVNEHMRNRPGRIFYLLDFKGVDAAFIREYCEDHLVSKQHTDQLINISSVFGQFNFDMLQATVEDMARFNESPHEVLEMLNAKPEYDGGMKYQIELTDNGKKLDGIYPVEYFGNPLNPQGVALEHDPDSSDDNASCINYNFTANHLISLDNLAGKFVFETGSARLVLTRIREKEWDYSKLIF